MGQKLKIDDAGQKLGGARKDTSLPNGGREDGPGQSPLLEELWPKPDKWTDLIPELGVSRAALAMVVYENLAKRPHRDGWLNISGEQWEQAYRFAIPVMREVLATPGKPELKEVINEFNQRMRSFEEIIGTPPRFADQWSYAIGSAGTRRNKHPLSFTPIDDLRWKYLPNWGWGTDSRVGNRLSMGALRLSYPKTGRVVWMSVKGTTGVWTYLEQTEFETEALALECTRKHVYTMLDVEQKPDTVRKPAPNWIRPMVEHSEIRTGFESPNSIGKTETELIEVFGFRGVEFGNWVTQSERRRFVDAAYDAFQDLTQLLGMPTRFASLGGVLGLAYGSRGKGLTNHAAHFEVGNWVLHMTKEHGAGALAHEFAHALDCWIADQRWGQQRAELRKAPETVRPMPLEWFPAFASEVEDWMYVYPNTASPLPVAYAAWYAQTNFYSDWEWVKRSKAMDVGRKRYWGSACELFARGFEVLVCDSLLHRSRINDMLVYGVSEELGQAQTAKEQPFPYPMGAERKATCQHMANVVRAFKAEFGSTRRGGHPSDPSENGPLQARAVP